MVPTRLILCAALLAGGLLDAAPAAAPRADDHVLTPEEVAGLKEVGAVAVSPDGTKVAYVKSLPRIHIQDEDGGSRSELHVMDWQTGESRPYVTSPEGVRSVHWTPDGQGIAFLAKRSGDEQTCLYVLPVGGGEARRAASFQDRSISAYDFSPSGRHLALIATDPESEARKKQKKQGFKQEIYEEDYRLSRLWVTRPFDEDAEPRQIDLDGHVTEAYWNPAGDHLAVAIAPTPLVDDGYMRKRIQIVNADRGEVVCRIENPGKLGPFVWSPDSRFVALIAGADINDGAAARLQVAPAVGGDASPDGVAPSLVPWPKDKDAEGLEWLADGRLLVLGSQGAWTYLAMTKQAAGQGEVSTTALLPKEGPELDAMSVSADGSRLAFVGSTPTHPRELFTMDLGAQRVVRRTDSNPWLANKRFAKQEVIEYPARDGQVVGGILIHPLDRDPNERVPLIVAVHGGPESHINQGWLTRYSYPGQVAAARGFAVFYPNYRGSTGQGLAYLRLSQGDPAGKEFDDIVDGVDHLIGMGLVDKDKVGVTGGSYGGYATAWMSTYYSDRFAAGVMFVGISNKISKVGTTDIPDEEYYVHALKRPWENWQFFLERSPVYYADRGRTPLLILGGKDDPRVDPGQSRELYRHLKLRGQAPVRLVQYPGEGHGNRMAAARYDYHLRMMRWLEHYLTGEGGDMPAFELDYGAIEGKAKAAGGTGVSGAGD